MDKNQVINLLITMVVTIVTTAVVTRLSLNKGNFGITSKLKARFTPKLRAYIKIIALLPLFIGYMWLMYRYMSEPDPRPVERRELLGVIHVIILGLLVSYAFGRSVGSLINALRSEKEEREVALLRAHEEALLAQLKPITEKLRAAVERAEERDRKQTPAPPKDEQP